MYEEFFGLTEKPFSIQPDPSFLYWGRSHRLAYAMLEYGVLNHAGISVITGEVGCGKTTLIHRLLDQLSDTHSVALLSNIQDGRGDLLSWVLMGFGRPFAGKAHVELFAELQEFFVSEYSKGRRVILIIDEAQNLSVDMLEELRMLSNINAGKDQLLQLILVGQPQLKNLLNRPDMLQLAQRIGSDFHLTPLSREEVDAYIETRLMIAGARQSIFTERAVDMIAEQSRGVPRVINIIADTALVYAFSAQEETVDVDTVANVVRDKFEFGVFGIATRKDESAPATPAGDGPSAFVREKPAAAVKKQREQKAPRAAPASPPPDRPALRRASDADAPRMPALRRQTAAQALPAQHTVVRAFTRSGAAPDASPAQASFAPETTKDDAADAPPAKASKVLRAVGSEPPESRAGEPALTSVGVVVAGDGETVDATMQSVGGDVRVVFVSHAGTEEEAAAAERAGANVLTIADRALSPGRARNAGYRELKKQQPNLAYVQFVETGLTLDPDWLRAATRFMDRRPEVAALEGAVPDSPAGAKPSTAFDECEVQTIRPTAFFRASTFESAGGFRGDLIVNETADLCIRLRRRGAHIWRISAPMATASASARKSNGWWKRAARRGFEYAHGADLYGAPPENLYNGEHLRAIVWGGVLPLLIMLAVGVTAGAAMAYFPQFSPYAAAGGVLGVGVIIYILKIVVSAFKLGGLRAASWTAALGRTCAHIPEFVGAWRFHFGGAKVRAAVRGVN